MGLKNKKQLRGHPEELNYGKIKKVIFFRTGPLYLSA
jgi:hypothetical protein